MREKTIIANWKMNKTYSEAKEYLSSLMALLKAMDAKREIIIAPPFTLLAPLNKELDKKGIRLCAQDIFYEKEGAFTGEICPKMVKEFADFVLVGHSERRKYFSETDDSVNKKIKAALKEGLKTVFCLGENLEEKKSEKTKEICRRQFENGLKDITNIDNVLIAYEPVWAIGTGNNAAPGDAGEVHSFLRGLVERQYGKKAADKIKILYGGSVTPENSAALMGMPDIDGCLVGGASLDPVKFARIALS